MQKVSNFDIILTLLLYILCVKIFFSRIKRWCNSAGIIVCLTSPECDISLYSRHLCTAESLLQSNTLPVYAEIVNMHINQLIVWSLCSSQSQIHWLKLKT